jgi:hypothetical protein
VTATAALFWAGSFFGSFKTKLTRYPSQGYCPKIVLLPVVPRLSKRDL